MNNNNKNDYIISDTVAYIYIVAKNNNENNDKNSGDHSDRNGSLGVSRQIGEPADHGAFRMFQVFRLPSGND